MGLLVDFLIVSSLLSVFEAPQELSSVPTLAADSHLQEILTIKYF